MLDETLTTNGPGAESSLAPGIAHVSVRFSDDFEGNPGAVRLEYKPSGTPPVGVTSPWASVCTFNARRGETMDIIANVADASALWRFSLLDRTAGTAWATAKSG